MNLAERAKANALAIGRMVEAVRLMEPIAARATFAASTTGRAKCGLVEGNTRNSQAAITGRMSWTKDDRRKTAAISGDRTAWSARS